MTPCYYTNAEKTSVYTNGNIDISNNCVHWSANGYRLPTEAEWEKATRGGNAEHRFSWSDVDTITHSQANYYSTNAYAFDISPTRGYHPTYATGEMPYTSPVGSFGTNGYGLYVTAGNVWEWCWDWFNSSWYSNAEASRDDTPGPVSGFSRTMRGGCWGDTAIDCRTSDRGSFDPSCETYNLGFRRVRGR